MNNDISMHANKYILFVGFQTIICHLFPESLQTSLSRDGRKRHPLRQSDYSIDAIGLFD